MKLTHCASWMISGWFETRELGPNDGGTALLTLGCPDDFHAVRLGFANTQSAPFQFDRVIGTGSSSFGDYINPTGRVEWRSFSFVNEGRDEPQIVSRPDVPTKIVVAGNSTHPVTGETTEPNWTWTDWIFLPSESVDPSTGMRVLMLRGLLSGGQRITFANGQLRSLTGNQELTNGYDIFVGGLKFGIDRVTDPTVVNSDSTKLWFDNHLASGSLFPLVQFLTRNAGVVGMVTGDSHQQGTTTTEQFTGFVYRATTRLGAENRGSIPFSMVNSAVGGATSSQFFSRLIDLLPSVRPSYVVLPGWTFNDKYGEVHASKEAMDLFYARLTSTIEICRRYGALVIVLTPIPRDSSSMSPVQLEAWIELRLKLKSVQSPGVLLLDSAAILGQHCNNQLIGTYLPNLTIDQMHPDDRGHSELANELSRLLLGCVRLPREA